jgi:hypothetical protein
VPRANSAALELVQDVCVCGKCYAQKMAKSWTIDPGLNLAIAHGVCCFSISCFMYSRRCKCLAIFCFYYYSTVDLYTEINSTCTAPYYTPSSYSSLVSSCARLHRPHIYGAKIYIKTTWSAQCCLYQSLDSW